MSAICGIVHLDGRPVDPETIGAMMAPMAELGPDGEGLWCDGPVGFGHRLFRNTPEAHHETQPLRSADHQFILTASARIDNRDDLFGALSIPHPKRATMPDGTLILKAYEKWGEDCPQHLLGDWSFAVWDAQKQKLFLARDHFGQTELVYYHTEKIFAFASSIKALLTLPEVPQKPHELRVGQLLACLGWPSEQTCYEGIRFLCVAHALTVTPRAVHLRRYWHPENTPDLHLSSDEEYIEAFLDLYSEAVRCRLRSAKPVCTTLSGGLDSGSVAVLAARELQKQGKRLPAFTSVPTHDPGDTVGPDHFADELPYAKATARQAGRQR